MPRAARRIFLENGDEIKNDGQFMPNGVVYVSCGEDFDDPNNQSKQLVERRKTSLWTSSGIQFRESIQNEADLDELNKNNNLTETQKTTKKADRIIKTIKKTKRLMVFENGKDCDSCQVVIEVSNRNDDYDEEDFIDTEKQEQEYLKNFLSECSSRLKMTTAAKIVYNWNGEKVEKIEHVPKIDKCLQVFINKVEYTPIWVSKGEGFDSYGALNFIENLLKFSKEYRKATNKKIKKIQNELEKLKKDTSKSKSVQMQINEREVSLSETQTEKEDFTNAIETLESQANHIKSVYEEQVANGNSSLFKHIKEVSSDDRLLGASKGIKLKVIMNGTDRCFDVLLTPKFAKQYDQALFEICNGYKKYDKFSYVKFTRLFNERGFELKPPDFRLYNFQTIYASTGDNWKDPSKIDMTYVVRFLNYFL